MTEIPMREVLHFLGWRAAPLEPELLEQIKQMTAFVQSKIAPRVIIRRFPIDQDHRLAQTVFTPKGDDVMRLLDHCDEAVLMAATLGAESERMLLRTQAVSSVDALLMDAVLSATIEAVCDEQEEKLRRELLPLGLYLTDRFSPGYGDMPLEQTKEICAVLQTQKSIGLSVSHSGLMIPRKSVTAIMGVSKREPQRRPRGCVGCAMRENCALREV